TQTLAQTLAQTHFTHTLNTGCPVQPATHTHTHTHTHTNTHTPYTYQRFNQISLHHCQHSLPPLLSSIPHSSFSSSFSSSRPQPPERSPRSFPCAHTHT